MNKLELSVLGAAVALALAPAVLQAEALREGEMRVQQTTVSSDAQGNVTTTRTVRFEEWDADSDGIIVREEIPLDSEFAGVWMEYDADGDLRITPVEFQTWLTADVDVKTVETHTATVTNADGSTTELTTTTTVTFDDWDADDDGVLIRSEIPDDSEFSTVWMEYDADRDLVISPAELEAWVVIDEREEGE